MANRLLQRHKLLEDVVLGVVELGRGYLHRLLFELEIVDDCAHSFSFDLHPLDLRVSDPQLLRKRDVLLL